MSIWRKTLQQANNCGLALHGGSILLTRLNVAGLAILSLLAVMLAGCSHKMTQRFDPAEYSAYSGSGDGAILGQGFLRDRGGRIVPCARQLVLFTPATAYTREWAMSLRSGWDSDSSEIARLRDRGIGRMAVCDRDGSFAAKNLKPGRWIAAIIVLFPVGYSTVGSAIWGEVDVRPGLPTEMILTK
ncbi:hypothetical protein [Inquilinus sp. CA228]|uniref:hypothetical protein n=1 Tax=Inquilinus sp. CA228 TaxID=3455609 RepID=UPI003F8D6369